MIIFHEAFLFAYHETIKGQILALPTCVASVLHDDVVLAGAEEIKGLRARAKVDERKGLIRKLDFNILDT